MSLEELRDIVIVIYGVLGIILLFVLIIVVLAMWLIVRRLSNTVQALMEDPVRPTLDEVHLTVQNVRGASEFMVDRAVHPVIRGIAVVRGVRRGVSVVTGIPSRLRR